MIRTDWLNEYSIEQVLHCHETCERKGWVGGFACGTMHGWDLKTTALQ